MIVRSLAEVGKTGLLNNNITKVTPEPAEVQAEASGRQYVTGGGGGRLVFVIIPQH